MDSFDTLIQQARQQAREVGLKRSDVAKAITRARTKK
jgi:hypothetical protein